MPLKQDLEGFKQSSNCDDCYGLGADATGDIPHVVAAIQKRTKTAVVIFEHGVYKGDSVKATLKQLGVPDARVFLAREDAIRQTMKPMPDLGKLARNPARNKVSKLAKDAGLKFLQLHESTDAAKDALGDRDTRKRIHEALRGGNTFNDRDEVLAGFWDAKPLQWDRPQVILWARWSGKTKSTDTEFGPHPYGDSSVTGLIQIARKCLEKKWGVIVAGDIRDDRASSFPAGTVLIGRFWSDKYWAGNGPNQWEQLRMFHILKLAIKPRRLVHVGMRSGNLDYYGFAGQDVIYIVAAGVPDVRITPLTQLSGSRWKKVEPAQPPKRQFASDWNDDWLNLVKSTQLRDLVTTGSDFEKACAKFRTLNSTSTEEQLHAKLLYKMVKADMKAGKTPSVGTTPIGASGLEAFHKERARRGYSETDLNTIIQRIDADLTRK